MGSLFSCCSRFKGWVFSHGNLTRLFVGTVCIFAIMSVLNPDRFFTQRNFTSMSFQFPELGIFALAIMVSLITGGIDLSVISIANLAGILGAFILTSPFGGGTGGEMNVLGIGAACTAMLGASLLLGLLNGVLIAYLRITPILATLGTMQLYMGISFVLTRGHAVAGYPESFLYIGNGFPLRIPIPLAVFLLLVVLFHCVLNKTRLGIHLYMMGSNPTAARFSGIDVRKLIVKTYTLSGFLSGVAGLIMISRVNSAKADYGSSYLLQAVLVAILAGVNPRGGFGSVWGLVFAVLSLQFLSSGLNMLRFHDLFGEFINNFTKEFTWGALLLVVMVVNTCFEGREVRR